MKKASRSRGQSVVRRWNIRSRQSVAHASVACNSCGWSSEDYMTAEASAAAHVRETGHTVGGELGMSVCWWPVSRDAEPARVH